ncbi:MAG: hypothetical protein LKG06_02130, partial [Bifidobacterium subtile]|nr:hypothetical protein [Bifidobacterium subtile]
RDAAQVYLRCVRRYRDAAQVYLRCVRRYRDAAQVYLRCVRRYLEETRVSDGPEPPFSAGATRGAKELTPHMMQIDLRETELALQITQIHV